MTVRKLNFGRAGAEPGKARSLVVFLHGYGADGADLLGLADPLAPHLADCAFVAPDAPERPHGTPFGRAWFPIPWLDGSSEAMAAAGLSQAAVDLNGFLDGQLADYGLGADRLVLVGFSQGAMMAMHVAPRRDQAMAGVVAIAGRLLAPEKLALEARVKPPVLLIHGDQDQVVPFGDMQKAGQGLTEAGFDCFGHVMRGCGHGIAPDGLQVTLAFLQERLGS